ncbi:MAG: hypothetical protein WBW00_01195, partial [Pseudolabrys sp.]
PARSTPWRSSFRSTVESAIAFLGDRAISWGCKPTASSPRECRARRVGQSERLGMTHPGATKEIVECRRRAHRAWVFA